MKRKNTKAARPLDEAQLLWKCLHDINEAALALPGSEMRLDDGAEAITRHIVRAVTRAAQALADGEPLVTGPPALLAAQEVLRQFERDTRDDQGTQAGRSSETDRLIRDMQTALNRVSAGLKEDPLSVVRDGVPPCLRPDEVEEMRLTVIDLKGFVERLTVLVVGNDPLGSYSPAGSALNKLVQLERSLLVADTRLQARSRLHRPKLTPKDCKTCDGTGETWTGSDWSGHKDCEKCDGTGKKEGFISPLFSPKKKKPCKKDKHVWFNVGTRTDSAQRCRNCDEWR